MVYSITINNLPWDSWYNTSFFTFKEVGTKFYGNTIQMEPLQQNFEIVLFISEDFTNQKFFLPCTVKSERVRKTLQNSETEPATSNANCQIFYIRVRYLHTTLAAY